MINRLRKELHDAGNPKRAGHDSRYFKTRPGEYGEGRISLGVETSFKRELAKKYVSLPLGETIPLLKSDISDYKFLALVILHNKYKKADKNGREMIVKLYLENTKEINNWDIVDVSAYNILGDFLLERPRDILYKLAVSNNLWERRIAIVSTYAFIRVGQLEDTLKISKILLKDKHDLMHKAVGWMLREVGKKDAELLKSFLKENYSDLPRTTLRYAIERFPEAERKMFLKWRG